MLVNSFLTYIRCELNLSVHTVSSYKRDIEQWREFATGGKIDTFEPRDVTTNDLRLWVAHLAQNKASQRSIRRKVQSVRAFYRYLNKYHNIENNPAAELQLARVGKELPIYSVETDEKKVALSFDAAWGNEDTQQILDILKEHNIHVTFFMTGGWVGNFPEDVKKIKEAGHDLGNHSENHKNMSQLPDSECQQELLKVHEKVKEITGVEMDLFRPPYGDYDNEVIKNATSCGYYTIQWDVDSLDWKDYGVDNIIKTVTEHKNLKNGSIILMHNGAKYTAEALPKVIEGLKAKGYEIVPISELIYKENYHLDVTGRQIKD